MDSSSKTVKVKNSASNSKGAKKKQSASKLLYDEEESYNSVGLIHPEALKLLYSKEKPNKLPSSKRAQNLQVKKSEEKQRSLRSSKKSYQELHTVLSDFEIDKPDRREGNEKLSYNYLYLDSRKLSNSNDLNSFKDAIFYVGKGKNNRAFSHTKEAIETLSGKRSSSKKINKIAEIWNDDSLVNVLKIAEDKMAEEAYTREALMIEAIGKKRLTNLKDGSYYGFASTLSPREKRELGKTLLEEAREAWIRNGADSIYLENSTKRGNKLEKSIK